MVVNWDCWAKNCLGSPRMKIIEATSISDAFDKAVDFLPSWLGDDSPCWFRGSKDNSLGLLPGGCWRNKYEEIGPLVTFLQEGAAFVEVSSLDSWEFYYLAQHHGIPTRLLDWTESFSAALFFALDNWDESTTPCIWLMKPVLLNEAFIGWNGIMAPESGSPYTNWLPNQIAEDKAIVKAEDNYVYDNNWPLAIYPKKSNRRIAAQQGAFTVHGRKSEPLDSLFSSKSGSVDKAFARIDLVNCERRVAMYHLATLGIRRAAIYPDVDNLVQQICEEYDW